MATLLDIVPQTRSVPVCGVNLTVQGVALPDLVSIVVRFPALTGVLSGKGVDVTALVGLGREVCGAVIAAATGCPGNPEAEAKAASLPAMTQVDIVAAAVDLTFPGEPVTVAVERLAAIVANLAGASSETASKSLPKRPKG
ncbi:MAG: hypothetical protein VR70_05820 [Rhodospirillaceae bacterium BRH_c57]|nr:MAG: hypothetical protein VR70_05820 [Rhodospirillaceae bacterium BRH_c57]